MEAAALCQKCYGLTELLIHCNDILNSIAYKEFTPQPKKCSSGFMIMEFIGLTMFPIITQKQLASQNHYFHLESQQLQSLAQESHKIGATNSAILEGEGRVHILVCRIYKQLIIAGGEDTVLLWHGCP